MFASSSHKDKDYTHSVSMRYFNLSAASKIVSDFLSQNAELADEEKNFLIDIQNRIRAIITAQAWLDKVWSTR